MSKVKEKLKSLLGTAATAMIDHDTYGWPPECSWFAYQPIHPNAKQHETISNEQLDQKHK